MSNVLDEPETFTFVELQQQLGGVPGHRILLRPTPGTATEADVMRLLEQRGVRCELIDGTLVEKEMGWKESVIASRINRKIGYLFSDERLRGDFGGTRRHTSDPRPNSLSRSRVLLVRAIPQW